VEGDVRKIRIISIRSTSSSHSSDVPPLSERNERRTVELRIARVDGRSFTCILTKDEFDVFFRIDACLGREDWLSIALSKDALEDRRSLAVFVPLIDLFETKVPDAKSAIATTTNHHRDAIRALKLPSAKSHQKGTRV